MCYAYAAAAIYRLWKPFISIHSVQSLKRIKSVAVTIVQSANLDGNKYNSKQGKIP